MITTTLWLYLNARPRSKGTKKLISVVWYSCQTSFADMLQKENVTECDLFLVILQCSNILINTIMLSKNRGTYPNSAICTKIKVFMSSITTLCFVPYHLCIGILLIKCIYLHFLNFLQVVFVLCQWSHKYNSLLTRSANKDEITFSW